MTEDKTRISVLIDKELAEELAETVPWGMRTHVISSVLRLVLSAIKKDGQIMIGALMSGNYRLVFDYTEENNDAET